TTGTLAVQLDWRRCRSTVQPSTRGIARSSRTTSGVNVVVLSMPMRPSEAVKTTQPFDRRNSEYMRLASASSSITRIVGGSVDRPALGMYGDRYTKRRWARDSAILLPAFIAVQHADC